MQDTAIHFHAQKSLLDRPDAVSLSTVSSVSPLQSQVDGLVGGFVHQATDWRTLMAMTAGGMAYRVGRIGAMGLAPVPGIRAVSVGLGLGAEVSAFELTHRGLNSLHSENSNLWRWSGPGGLRQGLFQSFISFGALKGAGHLARGENLIAQHLLQDTAMVAGHQVTGILGLAPRPTGSLAEQFLHAEATNLQIGAGLALAYRMSPGVHALERGLDLSVRSSDRSTVRWPEPRDSRMGEGTSAGTHPFFRLAFADASSRPNGIERPGDLKSFQEPNILKMARHHDEGGSGSLLAPLLAQTGRLKEPRAVKIALRLLHAATYGPLREEIQRVLLSVDQGQSPTFLLRSLAKDARVHQTHFLSREAHARVTAKISELRRGTPQESGTYYFDPKAASAKAATTTEKKNSVPNTGEELLRLNSLRLSELERLLSQPETESFPFSAKEALAEAMSVAQFLERTIRNYRKLAEVDTLTGFFSRRGLERFTPSIEGRLLAQRRTVEESKLADYGLMIDIDHFKLVNDQYGHPNGDEVIREVAQLIRRIIRLRDMRFRYGGEEFFIVLAKAGQNGALEIAERIRKAVENEPIEIEGFDPIRVTVSIGVAELRLIPSPENAGEWTKEGALADVIQRSDDALYVAKNSGRNRVHLSRD